MKVIKVLTQSGEKVTMKSSFELNERLNILLMLLKSVSDLPTQELFSPRFNSNSTAPSFYQIQ